MYKLNACFYVLLRFVLHLWNVSSLDFSDVDVLARGYKYGNGGKFLHSAASRQQSNNKKKKLSHLGLGLGPG